jgi:hypothetical protein
MAEIKATERLFRELDGKALPSYLGYAQAVLEALNTRRTEFPAHYTSRDAISWARRRGWLHPISTMAFGLKSRTW